METNFYYIGYSFVESENSANQIQSRNTFENILKLDKNAKGIFVGSKGSMRNPFWKVRRENNKFLVDRYDFGNWYLRKMFKISVVRKDLFPYIFFWKARRILRNDKVKKNIYVRITNAEEGIFYLRMLNKRNIYRVVLEMHVLNFDMPNYYYWNFERKYCYRRYVKLFNLLENNSERAKLVTLTKSSARLIRNKFGYRGDIEIIPDAHNFGNQELKKVNFSKEKIEIIYTGLNFKFRGVEMIIDALRLLPDKFFVKLVGGKAPERESLRKKHKDLVSQQRLILEPAIPHDDIKQILMNADIAILPTPWKGFSPFTSPLKLFEYMAVGIPIIASNTSSFREILTEDSALFFKPGDSQDLANKIKYIAENEKEAKQIGERAFRDSKKYTYFERAKKIYELISR